MSVTLVDGAASRPEAGIELQAVSKRYGGPESPLAVDHVSLIVPRGTLTTLLGPSGCGKTTTLRLIAGLEQASAGRVLIDGIDVTALGPSERNVSMVFQSYALFPHMNVLENVRYGLVASRVPRDESIDRARRSLAGVGLAGYEERLPAQLSGGQQQRVALARALVLEPAVLLFDEPLSNLDARLRRSMRDEIRRLQQSLGLTVAYVTHDQTEALAVSDQIIVMERGRIAQAGDARAVFERPVSEFVAGFIGEAAVYDAERRADGVLMLGGLRLAWAADGSLAEPAESAGKSSAAAAGQAEAGPAAANAPAGRVRIAIRPEAWQVADSEAFKVGESSASASDADPGAAARIAGLPATLSHFAWLGAVIELHFDTSIGSVFAVSREVDRPWQSGGRYRIAPVPGGYAVIPPSR
jgi:iron(III) transport system ATP-binding protein